MQHEFDYLMSYSDVPLFTSTANTDEDEAAETETDTIKMTEIPTQPG